MQNMSLINIYWHYKMNSKKAFTLVELIVWVSISMVLMVSVWIILSSWVQNILKQEKIISHSQSFWNSIESLYQNFENIEPDYIHSSQSGTLFRAKDFYQKIGLAYLWVTQQTDSYCPADSEIASTNHLSWNFFFPYEEIWEDYLSDFSAIQSAQAWDYRVDTLQHQVFENDTKIMGKNNFWYEFTQGWNPLETGLNNPTGIVEAEGGFFLSDTGNHRVLFYKDDAVYLIADRHDGLDQPSWLAYTGSTLYIANSGKWEILTYSAKQYNSNPNLEIDFSPDKYYGAINRFEVSFTGANFTPDNTLTKNDFNFDETHFIKNEDYFLVENDTLKYYFSDFSSTSADIVNWPISDCTDNTTYRVTSGKTVEKIETSCISTSTGSRNIATWNNSYILTENNQYNIDISNISPQITQEWTYLAQVDFFNDNSLVYSKVFHYFTQSSWIISDYEYNTLEVFIDGLEMPTGLEISGNTLIVNDSINRETYHYDINTKSQISSSNMTGYIQSGLDNIIFNPLSDTIIENPIESVNFNYDSSNNYFWAHIQYYHYLNCYNPDEYISKELIFGKNLVE